MRMTTFVRGLGLAAALAVGACKSLDITNPNDPDAERALSDPAALEGLVGGSVQGWFNTFEGLEGTGPLVTQAQTYSSSWNNFNMDFYSGLDLDGTRNSRSWQNNPAAAQRTSISRPALVVLLLTLEMGSLCSKDHRMADSPAVR